MKSKSGTQGGAIEHKYGGKQLISVNRDHARLLLQEAQVRREFGEEGVKRFWEEVNRKSRQLPAKEEGVDE